MASSSLRSLSRHAGPPWRVLLITLLWGALSCSPSTRGCQEVDQTLRADLVEAPPSIESLLPRQLDLLLSAREAHTLSTLAEPWAVELAAHLLPSLPAEGRSPCLLSRRLLGASVCEDGVRKLLNIKEDSPVWLAAYRGHWLLFFSPAAPLGEPPQLPSFAPLPITARPSGTQAIALSRREEHPSERAALLRPFSSFSLLILPQDGALQTASALLEELEQLPAADQWRASPEHRDIQLALQERSQLWGVFSPDALLHGLQAATPDASRQRERLIAQAGELALGLWPHPEAPQRRWQGELLFYERAHEAMFIDDLGAANSPLPLTLGPLLPERAPPMALLHLAFDPPSFFQLIRSSMSAEQRLALDDYLSYLKKEMVLDLHASVIDNLTGHAFWIGYGWEEEPVLALEEGVEEGLPMPSFGVPGVAEALYLPLQERAPLEQLLNALTQLSQGALKRQRVEDVIQYVWLVDGVLSWALLLSDDAVVYVDSSTAVEHAMRQLQSPTPLTAEDQARFGTLLPLERGVAGYLDLVALREKLAPGSRALIPPEVSRVVMRSSAQDERRMKLSLELWRSE